MGVTPRYRLVAGRRPDDAGGAVPWSDADECEAFALGLPEGSRRARTDGVLCTRPPGHDGPHWDPWECSAWELVR